MIKVKKLKIAKWVVSREQPFPKKLIHAYVKYPDTVEWIPEEGGQHLSDVLSKLSYNQTGHLAIRIKKTLGITLTTDIGLAIWFQNDNNAETILRDVYEVIK